MKIKSIILSLTVYINLIFGFSLDSGLVAYYPFNGNANDECNGINTGVINGVVFTTDRFGNDGRAAGFNGASSFIDCGNNSILNFSNRMAVSLWIYTTNTTNEMHIISRNDGTNKSWDLIQHNPAGRYVYRIGDPEAPCDNITTGQWVHLCANYNGTVLSIYKNGALCYQAPGNPAIQTVSYHLFIGKSASTRSFFFNGKIDDIRIYKRALSDNEIMALWSGASPNDSMACLITIRSPIAEPRPVFRWLPVIGALSYRIQISTDSLFSSFLVDTTLSDTIFQPVNNLSFKRIYWRVNTTIGSDYVMGYKESFLILDPACSFFVPRDFITLQDAINTSPNGGRIYCDSIPDPTDSIVINNKSLFIRGYDSLAQMPVFNGMIVLNNSNSTLENLIINGKNGRNGANSANLSGCGFRATAGEDGQSAMVIRNSGNIILRNLTLRGGKGGDGGVNMMASGAPCNGMPGGDGGDALISHNSKISLKNILVRGGMRGASPMSSSAAARGIGGRFLVSSIIDTFIFNYDSIYNDLSSSIYVGTSTIQDMGRKPKETDAFFISPTPFNPSTAIHYAVEKGQRGIISIYSGKGDLIYSQTIKGQGRICWNAGRVASGIYLCQLKTATKSFSKKMVLIR